MSGQSRWQTKGKLTEHFESGPTVKSAEHPWELLKKLVKPYFPYMANWRPESGPTDLENKIPAQCKPACNVNQVHIFEGEG